MISMSLSLSQWRRIPSQNLINKMVKGVPGELSLIRPRLQDTVQRLSPIIARPFSTLSPNTTVLCSKLLLKSMKLSLYYTPRKDGSM